MSRTDGKTVEKMHSYHVRCSQVTIIVSRTDGKTFEKMHRTIKAVRPDVAILYLNSRVVSASRKLM
eukprot:4637782-Pyramimonas_sp.AAC.1